MPDEQRLDRLIYNKSKKKEINGKISGSFFCGARSQGSVLCKPSIPEHPERTFGPETG